MAFSQLNYRRKSPNSSTWCSCPSVTCSHHIPLALPNVTLLRVTGTWDFLPFLPSATLFLFLRLLQTVAHFIFSFWNSSLQHFIDVYHRKPLLIIGVHAYFSLFWMCVCECKILVADVLVFTWGLSHSFCPLGLLVQQSNLKSKVEFDDSLLHKWKHIIMIVVVLLLIIVAILFLSLMQTLLRDPAGLGPYHCSKGSIIT